MRRDDSVGEQRDADETDNPPFPGRQQEHHDITKLVDETGPEHIYINGPRGSGKTAVTTQALDTADTHAETVYLSGLKHDTQYKVLQELCDQLTDESLESGHHTTMLKRRFEDFLNTSAVVVVLDEIDFLLENDGNDLLYYLSRVSAANPVSTISISANYAKLASMVDTRTYSSLHPKAILFDRYSEEQTYQILHRYADNEADEHPPVYPQAIEWIADTTSNIRFGKQWLHTTVKQTDTAVTKDEIKQVHDEVVQRYRDVMLQDFTPHHSLLLEAVHKLCTDTQDTAFAGDVYDRYTELCSNVHRDTLSTRRLSDFLTHLDLLGLIDAEYHRGGKTGKTREIQLITEF